MSDQRVAVKYLIRGEAQKRRPRFEVGTEVYVFRPYGDVLHRPWISDARLCDFRSKHCEVIASTKRLKFRDSKAVGGGPAALPCRPQSVPCCSHKRQRQGTGPGVCQRQETAPVRAQGCAGSRFPARMRFAAAAFRGNLILVKTRGTHLG